MKNLERYQNDLDKLISEGELLKHAMIHECNPEALRAHCKKSL